MELQCDLSSIHNEELLRKMWQQSQDIDRKKDIRSQLCKLRELRLRDLYQLDSMSDNRVAGFNKDPLAPSHGDSLVDQSFQSLKSKEVRDSMSPTEMKFHSMTLNNPNTTGWDVQSSSEVSPDGRRFRAETIATTDGVEHVNGGTAEFKGRNEQQSSAMHEGDDKNFLKKASESSKSHLQEKVVIGDENSGRTEVRTSSSTSTSSSQVFKSSSNTDYDNDRPRQYIMDSNSAPKPLQEPQYRPNMPYNDRQEVHDSRHTSDQSSIREHYDQHTEQYRQNRHESNTSQNIQTNETLEQNKRYVDMDKASPEYQRHVQNLMAQPGEIISNTVEYPKPNVKMITTVKRLPDGTIVRNKRYETEEPNPVSTSEHVNSTRQTSSNQTNLRRETQTNQPTKNYREPSERPPSERYRQPNEGNVDYVDIRDDKHYTHDTHSDNVHHVETKYSTVKSSNRKVSTETTSEHVEEYDDRHGPVSPGSRARPATNSFSTHGFPSVKANKPTQEFATDRPNLGYPSQNLTSPRVVPVPVHGDPRKIITERRIPTSDGEVIIVSSEKTRNVKHHTNSEQVIETDIRSTDDHRHQNISDVTTKTTQDFSTHGFPSVREPKPNHPDNKQVWPVSPGRSPRGYEEPDTYGVSPSGENVVISSQKSHTSKYSTNTERSIETEVMGDDGRPRLPTGNMKITITGHENQPHSPAGHYTVTTPGTPYMPNTANQDFSTQIHHTVKTQTDSKPDYSSQGYPSARPPTRVTPGYAMPKDANKPRGDTPSSKKPNTVIETTKRVIQKEKEVDAAHRAFAASLRSNSPVDNTRRDSCSTDGNRHTPTRTFRRDIREGSHDSAPASETSRISHSTVTRQTPPKTDGGRSVVSKQTVVTTKNGSDIISTSSPRGSKSPSPGKTVTTTTTTRTVTSKAMPKDVPKSELSPRSSPAPSSRSSPYPSKSKGPLGEDDQSYTSRPLSPTSPTRSPKPIGPKDVPNSRGPRPAASDERRTVDRDTVIEVTNTVVDDRMQEDVDFGHKDKKVMKTLKPHKADDAPKRAPLKPTSSPPLTPTLRNRSEIEESKRPKSIDQPMEKHPRIPSKLTTTTITSVTVDERKAQMPKNIIPGSPRKGQPVNGDSLTKAPSKVKPKNDGENIERHYPETENETTEFASQITTKKNLVQEVNKTINRQKPQPMESENIPNKYKPQVPGKVSSPRVLETDRKPETPQKAGPKNVVPQSKPLPRSTTRENPKYNIEHVPSDEEPITKDVCETTEFTSQITAKKIHGKEIEYDNDIIRHQRPQPTESEDTPSKYKPHVPGKLSPTKLKENERKPQPMESKPQTPGKMLSKRLIENERKPETPRKDAPKNVGPQSKPMSRTITAQKPKRHDDEHIPSDDEPIISDIDETTEFTSQITTKKIHSKDIIEDENEIIKRRMTHKNIPNEYNPNTPRKVSSTKLVENEKKPETPRMDVPKNVGPQSKPMSRTITAQKPKRLDDEHIPSDDEPIISDTDETTEFTSQITTKKIHSKDIIEDENEIIKRRMTHKNIPNEYNPNTPGKVSSTKLVENEKKPETPRKDVPKNFGPQSKPMSRTITAQKPKRHDDEHIPSDDEPIISDTDETTEFTSQITMKKIHSKDIIEDENEIINRRMTHKNIPNEYNPNTPGKVSSTRLIENEKKPQTPRKDTPTNVGPKFKPLTGTLAGQKPKPYNEDIPSDDEPITSDVYETTEFTSQITTKKVHGKEINDDEHETINRRKPHKNIPNEYNPNTPGKVSSTRLIENEKKPETPRKDVPKNVGPQSKPMSRTIIAQKPKRHDDEHIPSDDEPIISDTDETTEFTSQITTQKIHSKDIREDENDIINRRMTHKNIPNEYNPNTPGKVSSTRLIENEKKPETPLKNTPTNVGPQFKPLAGTTTGKKPKPYNEDIPSDDEPITSDVYQTTEFTSQITTKKVHGKEINDDENETINRRKPQPTEFQNIPNKYTANIPGKVSPAKSIENERKPDAQQKVGPKHHDDHIPSDDEPIISDDYKTTESASYIKTEKTRGREVKEYEHKIIDQQRPQPTFSHNVPNKYTQNITGMVSSTKLIENERKPENPKNVGPQSKILSEPLTDEITPDERIRPDVFKTTDSIAETITEETYEIEEGHQRPQPVQFHNVPNKFQSNKNIDGIKPKHLETEIDDDLTENNFREISEITIQSTRKHSPIRKDLITIVDEQPNVVPKLSKEQQSKHPSGKPSSLTPKNEQIKPDLTQTSTITIETTDEDLLTFNENCKTEPNISPDRTRPISNNTKSQQPDRILKTSHITRDTNKTRKQQSEENVHEEFIKAERAIHSEIPDGSFISKTEEPVEPKSPSFNKKGASRRDTFEDRCRQILGMETYGNTLGTYKTNSIMETTVPSRKSAPKRTDESIFEVKIEDCGDDEDNDKPLTIETVKKIMVENKPTSSDTEVSDYDNSNKTRKSTTDKNVDKVFVTTTEKMHIDKVVTTIVDSEPEATNKRTPKPNKPVETPDVVTSNMSGTRRPAKSPSPTKDIESTRKDTKPLKKSVPESERGTKKPTSRTSTKSCTLEDNVSPQRSSKSPSPIRTAPLRNSPTNTTAKQSVKDEHISANTSIKDRLRSATRKDRVSPRPDQVDAGSSPETSPSRYTSRRRSSNISVNTEIIIEHTDAETVNKKMDSRAKKQTDSVYREIIDSTKVPEKMTKKMQVTERKESAPVQRVTRKDKDSKMSRSTSETIIKVKKPEPNNNLLPQSHKMPHKSSDQRRPNKCFTTKTINLSTMDHRISSKDMENVVIDIQQAKSSREPSPDKIVPTPVPAHFDTGKPRYPDVVQEPEDEPNRRPIIKNIPIFEEEHNKYVGCHITEVNIEKSRKTNDSMDYRDEIVNTPVVEAPSSLDDSLPTDIVDDECVLSVHDKVSKFQHIATEFNKPKPSTPFNREYDDITHVPDDDECLLTVDEKVDKFLKTAESLTRGSNSHERDTTRRTTNVTEEDLDTTECTYTPVKLGQPAPQRSPELVRHISRNISRQSDVSEQDDNPHHIFVSQEKETISRRTTQEPVTHHKLSSPVKPKPQPVMADYSDDDELIPHTASHTTILEERRQKNILSRPSVFDNNKNKPPTRRTQPKNVSPVKDSEKSTTINKTEEKIRAKPETPKQSTLPDKTSVTTTKTSVTFGRKHHSPQPTKPDVVYENRRSSVETSVSSNITKQTHPHSSYGPKKSPQQLNKKPDRHSPLRTNKAKNAKEEHGNVNVEVGVDYVDDIELEVVPCDREKKLIINADTAIRSATITKATDKTNVRKEPTHITNTSAPLATKKMKENQISSTCSSPSKGTKAHLVDITEKSTQKYNTTTTKTVDLNKFSEANESIFETPTGKKYPVTPLQTKTRGATTDSVAARRILFENKATTNNRTPSSAASISGRRPSYMDHTKSSLEHIRRDSLELSKTNLSRKPSAEHDDDVYSVNRDTHVKFDVPQKIRIDVNGEVQDLDIEEIFDIEILERMLETVTSYELRRRIRAQIRLVKKNQSNAHQKHPETTAKTNGSTKDYDRGASPVTSIRETTKKQYYYREEERTSSSTHTSPERIQRIVTTKETRTQSPESAKSTSPSSRIRHSQQKPASVRPHSRNHDRSPSPDSTRVIRNEVTSSKHYDYKNEKYEQFECTENTDRAMSPTPRRSSRKSPSPRESPERHVIDSSKSPTRKTPTGTRPSSKSPDNKHSSTIKTNSRYEQSVTATQAKRSPVAPSLPKGSPEEKVPVWADRKNVLKAPGKTTTPKNPKTVTGSRTASLNKTVKSTSDQIQKHISNKSTYVEDDCITSSYGIGPTDENGLPLFGIRALKKKKPTPDSCETTEEITGYVVEEKYYSDNKSKPIVERKEIIYSNNPRELDAIREKTKETIVKKSQRGKLVTNNQPAVSTQKTTTAVRSGPEDSMLESTTRTYVRRGSVKEMSEKFIHKEMSSSINEKANNYPKAGLILRTNSRQHFRDGEDIERDNTDIYETRGSEEENNESFVRVRGSTHTARTVGDSESECESMQTQRQIKQTTSSSRSFLNSKGEEKIITNVTDVLDRMRNADDVVEDGDTAEDQEARAMLNKFLGASIIMKGVEGAIPINSETKTITTTTSTAGQQPTKREVKTTRVTKTIKSGSSSSPVIETTCDIEEICDEEILKQLLDQARTYEERRKIRSRLRELMADRQENKDCQAESKSAADKITESSSAQRSDSSASEYEEIEEEVTDSSDCEEPISNESKSNGSAQESAKPTNNTNSPKNTEVTKNTKNNTDSDSKYSAESNKKLESSSETSPPTTDKSQTEAVSNEETDSESIKPPSPVLTLQQTTQQTNQTVGDSSPHSERPGSNSSENSSSDRSMHAPNNKSSSSAQYTGQTPIVTVTAGRADNTYSGRDISSVSMNNPSDVVGSTGRQVDRLGVPQKEDSGTESGEDLRLIAAGLRDQLQMNSDSNIIDDVTFALSRLESSLKDGKGICVDAEKRKALLALITRLQDGLTCPEKLAEIAAAMSELDGNDVLYGETSSPEADAHRSGKQRFAKRRNRVNRHTVGVSREELADARRYMEDMLIMGSMSQITTPEANANTSPKWFPLEKNVSSSAILLQQPIRQNFSVPGESDQSTIKNKQSLSNGNKRRPVSGDFSVSFEPMANEIRQNPMTSQHTDYVSQNEAQRMSPENSFKNQRFSNKKQLMKRANTIDLAKAKRFGSDFDTDSDAEDKSHMIGLKRAIHPTVKKQVQNVVPPFEPKTENDRKFLAFINKQSDKPGLGWTNSRSVSNWTNKFGNLKNSFEIGATAAVTAAKPPQVPGHQLKLHPNNPKQSYSQREMSSYAPTNQQIAHRLQQEADRQSEERRRKMEYEALKQRDAGMYMQSNQQVAQRLQKEAERLAEERRRKLEYERMKYEERERENTERQRQLQQQQQHQQQQQQQQQQMQERLHRERLEREYYEKHMRDHDMRLQHAQTKAANIPQPMPINEFKHAPQSVFRPIDNGDAGPKPIYRPIPQLPTTSNTWKPSSPHHNPFAKPDDSFITSPPPSSKSPVALPWAAKPAVDASSFKNKANRFEERSKYDNCSNPPVLQRHNSLRAPNDNSSQIDDFKKRPSLPNTTDPFGVQQIPQQSPLQYLPPPTNISYVYDSRPSKPTYLSYPCLPTAVSEPINYRCREDSLTNPKAVPLVLTSANPSYSPAHSTANQQFQPYDAIPPFNISSPANSALASPSGPSGPSFQADYTDDDIESDSLLEYRAVSRVMAKPKSQTAVTVGKRTGHVSDDEVYGKNSKAAKNLLSTMKSIGSSGSDTKRQARTPKRPEATTSPKTCLSPDGRSYQAPIVDPLFPDVTRFESNRQHVYGGPVSKQPTSPVYLQNENFSQAPRGRPSMYKSLENISMGAPANTHVNAYVPQRPLVQPQVKPYVSETLSSYVVSYPIDDTTDDEEVYRHSRDINSDSLPLRRARKISETSTVSSTTASIAYANNIPSPNTSWTSNPIVSDESIGQSLYNACNNQQLTTPKFSQYQTHHSPVEANYTSAQYQQRFSEPKYEPMTEPGRPAAPKHATVSSQLTKTPQVANCGGAEKVKLQNQRSHPPHVSERNEPHCATKCGDTSQTNASVKQQPAKQEKQQVKPQQIVYAQPQATKNVSGKVKQNTNALKTESKAMNKKPLSPMGKSVVQEYSDINKVSSVREQTSTMKVSQKSVATKVSHHQSEIVSKETRRPSLGNTLNSQNREVDKIALTESQQSQKVVYKSSAPADTPDIVKSSLPKDENQPILKKFGPPQRHHYMPNAYMSPVASTGKATAGAISTTISSKSVEVATNKSILKTSQQTAKSTKPIVVENPATPQPDDDYIPRNIVFNNVFAFTSMSRRPDDDRSQTHDHPIRTNKLCKSESWKQIINLQNQNTPQPVPRLSQPPINELRRTKSGHSLVMPKMYEASIDKTDVNEKQNIMAAYFAANKSPTQQEQSVMEQSTKRSVINRTKTSEKISACRKSLGSHVAINQGGLARSATMPHIGNLSLLDETNVEDAFEQLMMGS